MKQILLVVIGGLTLWAADSASADKSATYKTRADLAMVLQENIKKENIKNVGPEMALSPGIRADPRGIDYLSGTRFSLETKK